jgi:hypothetical protein
MELYLYSPNTPSWRGAELKHRDNFAFTLPDITVTPVSHLYIGVPSDEKDNINIV